MSGINEEQLRDKHSETSDELKSQLAKQAGILKQYRKEHGKLQLFFDALTPIITPLDPVPVFTPDEKIGTTEIGLTMHISDVHYGATQDPDEIEGFNAFNIEICRKRCLSYAQYSANYGVRMRNAYNIQDCHIIVTGDLISGDIHQELMTTNEVPSPVQVVGAGNLLAEQIMTVAPHFRKVVVHFLVGDNHSRLTKKPQANEEGYNSLNYIVGHIAKSRTENQPNVEFNIYPQYEKVVTVNERQYLIMHGHGIKGWSGIPWYGLERKLAKESTARMQLIMASLKEFAMDRMSEIGFHKMWMGHFHTSILHPLYKVSASVQGSTALDHKDGRFSEPSQSTCLVHPRHGEFGWIDFNLK